jgi:hypothetical protein
MTQHGQFTTFMPGKLLHHHALGFPAARAFAVLPVIQISAIRAQQRQCGTTSTASLLFAADKSQTGGRLSASSVSTIVPS